MGNFLGRTVTETISPLIVRWNSEVVVHIYAVEKKEKCIENQCGTAGISQTSRG